MPRFIENFCCASRVASFWNGSITNLVDDGNIVFNRDPVERFWSATKKIYGTDGAVADYQTAISDALAALDNTTDIHLLPQVNNIAGKTIVQVIPLNESFDTALAATVETYGFEFCPGFSVSDWLSLNTNPQPNDADALSYIRGDTGIMAQLNAYYADDFAWWEDPNSKLGG